MEAYTISDRLLFITLTSPVTLKGISAVFETSSFVQKRLSGIFKRHPVQPMVPLPFFFYLTLLMNESNKS